jgi:HD superfamily phosphodiesterase
VETDRVFLWKSQNGPLWLVLPIESPGGDTAWAWVGFARPGITGGWGPSCPEPALRAWGQDVAERRSAEVRLHREDRGATSRARPARRPAQLLDELIRRMRVSESTERFQLQASRMLREELGAAAVAWVPGSAREAVVVGGAVPDLQSEQYRALVPDRRDESVRLFDVPGPHGPRRVAVVADAAEKPAGWLVLFDLADAATLGPAEIRLVRSVASLILTHRANARVYVELKDLLFGIIRALVSAIDAKDPYTAGHSERVARIAVRIGAQLGLGSGHRSDLYLMGLLHDIGKIGIDDNVLKKPGDLTPEEYRQIRSHVKIGVHILTVLKRLHYILPGVAHHHERFDGSGYPAGLAGQAIPLPARILAVADSYDAMSSNRPYRRRLSPEQIEAKFRSGSGQQWDPEVVDALLSCLPDVETIRQRGLGESLVHAVDDAMIRRPAGT